MKPGRVNSLNVMPVLFLAPAFLFFLVYVILPIFQSIYISFHEWDGLGEMTYVGAGNYVELLDDDRFYTSLKNNILWLVLYMLAVPVGLFVALFLNQTVTGIRSANRCSFFPSSSRRLSSGLFSRGSTTRLSASSRMFSNISGRRRLRSLVMNAM